MMRRLAVVAVLAALAGCSVDDTESVKHEASIMCEDFIEDRLVSPGSAKHPRNPAATQNGDRFTLASYVDSQNGFGAMIRTDYTCVIRLDGDMWRLVSLTAD